MGDGDWPGDDAVVEAACHFSGPGVALRALMSNVIVSVTLARCRPSTPGRALATSGTY
jgi:hypothetical protein